MELIFKNKSKLLLIIILFLTILAGLYFRLKGLGRYPLAVDEYYIMQSVQNILNFGLPKFHFSGFYNRGILFQYILAPLLLLGLKPEFAGRIIPAICNIVTLIPLYLLSKKISGKILASAIIFIFCFSVWEVEIARFARMYTPFQMIFMFYIYSLYKNLIEGDKRGLKWLLILSFISIFVYEGSIFLCILNFIPLIWNSERKTFDISRLFKLKSKMTYLLLSIIILAAGYAFLKINFRYLGSPQNELLPLNLPETNELNDEGGAFRIPRLLILTLSSSRLFLFLYIIPILAIVFSVYKVLKKEDIDLSGKFSFLVLISLSILNLFGLAIVLSILFYLIEWIKRKDIKAGIFYVLIPILLNFIYWTFFVLKTNKWKFYFPNITFRGSGDIIRVVWKEFLNYPYFYETFVLFRDTIPVYTYIISGLILLGLVLLFIKKEEKDYKFRILFALFIFLIIMVNILNLTYFETRYFFFLFPLILILVYSSLLKFITLIVHQNKLSMWAFMIIVFLILVISGDSNLKHLFKIDSKEINYRTEFTYAQQRHYYPRWDTRTPAEIINKNSKSGDVIITNHQVNAYYLNKCDYVYVDYRSIRFGGVSMDYGKKERWTGANLIYDDTSLINLLFNNDNTKWLIINTLWDINYLKKDNFFNEFKKYSVYVNSDSSAILYKIPSKMN